MPVTVSETHFSSGVWASDGPLRLVSHTCVVCGTRFKTFASFKAHRLGVATGTPCVPLDEQTDSRPAWALGVMTPEDRDALSSLIAQLPDPDLDAPLATLVDLHA